MLTDYHVHLRPDGPDTTAQQYFTEANAARYREHASARGIAELGIAEHIYRFRQALDVWEHPHWADEANDDLDEYCAFLREQTDLKLGIEADFIPGREERMRDVLEARDWDYVVGSIHFLGEHCIDWDGYDIWDTARSADEVWRTYFSWLGELAASGMFDILAHPDLVKHWGRDDPKRPYPERDVRHYYDLAIEQIADSGIAVEVSTAGLRKPTGELYPDRAFLELVAEAGNPIALSSDAHTPDILGFGYGAALELLADCGISQLAVFEGRQARLVPIEDADRAAAAEAPAP